MNSHGQTHVPTRTYVLVGVFLAVVTAIEIAIPYAAALKRWMVPLLLALGALKFATVAAFFMHLRFDRRVLTWVFSAGLAFAAMVALGLMIVMKA